MRTPSSMFLGFCLFALAGCAIEPIEGDNVRVDLDTGRHYAVFRGGSPVSGTPFRYQVKYGDTSVWTTFGLVNGSTTQGYVKGLGSFFSYELPVSSQIESYYDSSDRLTVRVQYRYNGTWSSAYMYDRDGIDCLNQRERAGNSYGHDLTQDDYTQCSVNSRLSRDYIYLCRPGTVWNAGTQVCD